jgi:hypothetical protein
MEALVQVLLIAATGAAVVTAIVRMRSKSGGIDNPVALSAFGALNEFVDPAAHKAQLLLDKKRNQTLAMPAAEGDPLRNGEVTIDAKDL